MGFIKYNICKWAQYLYKYPTPSQQFVVSGCTAQHSLSHEKNKKLIKAY